MKIIQLVVVFVLILLFSSCMKGESVDLVIHNAQIHTLDGNDAIESAIAIKDGIIVEVGPERQILNKYSAEEYIDAEQKHIYPGLTDAHGHIMSYVRKKLGVDLSGCRSYDELLVRVQKYQAKNNAKFIIGSGWDQTLWGQDTLPTNKRLNEVFPDVSVALVRVDGHSMLVNEYLLKSSDVIATVANDPLKYEGGYFTYIEDSIASGIIIDNAMNPIFELTPSYSQIELTSALSEVQSELYSYGITGVHEAGITSKDLSIIERWIEKDILDLNVYAMLIPSEENIAFARTNGVYVNENLSIRSFKVYADGALGSRGAFLKSPYADKPGTQGHLTTSWEEIDRIARLCEEIGYQMNTHSIGDSTNRLMLALYQRVFKTNPDHRWRIEHAQVIDPVDLPELALAGAFPSIQPTHAVSDHSWVESRLGSTRMNRAYAYKAILEEFRVAAIGTDFPFDHLDPFRTIHAATVRKDAENRPAGGFLPEQSISLDDCIRGMTQWAAMASFQEEELGTIENGKDATLVIFEQQIATYSSFHNNFANTVFIKGKKVYSVE
ncbi:MAG: putative amidohydrolase YtcJ [Flavobacteriaceae bacterium]|jgi:predicted amidohydrolase YtcJ